MDLNLEGTPDAVAVVDTEGRIVDCNAQMELLFGYSASELCGMSVDELVPEPFRGAHRHHRESYQSGPLAMRVAFRTRRLSARRKDGSEFPAEISLVPSSLAPGAATIAIVRDLTARVRAEEAQRQQEEATRLLFAASPLPSLVFDVDTLRFLEVNEAATAKYGYSRSEMLSMGVPQLHPSDDMEIPRVESREPGATLRVRTGVRHRLKDGREIVVDIHAQEMLFNGRKALLAVVHDVTEQRAAETALREAEERYRTVFEASGDAILVVRTPYQPILACNPAAVTLFRAASREAFLSRTARSLSPSIQADRTPTPLKTKRLKLDLARRGGTEYEWTFRRFDGSRFEAAVSMVPIEFDGKRALLLQIRDITEKKRAQEALRASEERFSKLFQANPEPILVTTIAESRIVNVNSALLALTGFSREELLGKRVPDLGLFANPEERLALLETVRREGSCRNVEVGFNRKGGSPGKALVSIEVIDVGNQPCLVGTIHDVTEQRRHERIRKVEFEVTRILSESATMEEAGPPVLQTLATELGWEYGDILLIDDEMSRCEFSCAWHDQSAPVREFEMYSRSGLELESDPVAQQLIRSRMPFWSSDLRGMSDRAQRAFECGLVSAVAVPFVSASRAFGALSLFSRRQRPLEPDLLSSLAYIGAEMGQFAARTRAQAELVAERRALARKVEERTAELSRANEELARTGKMKDQFLASMSHELRTPISAVLGLSEFLQQGIHGALNEKQARSLKTIEESGRHLLALVDDILDISKIEAGKVKLEPLPVWAESVCGGAQRFVSQAASRKRLTISRVVDPPSLKLRADERRLRQILVNLLANAVKFTPDGGEVGIIAREDPGGSAVSFTVWDTGIGIASENLARLFQPFTQLDSSLSRQHAGAGLGLALVKKLVDLHGGSVSIESKIGHGTRVTVSLPKTLSIPGNLPGLPVEAEEGPSSFGPPEGSGQVILLAEDHEAIAETTSQFLKMRGYEVLLARNGDEAVARALESLPALVLMDVHMPRMDGLEATRRIRLQAAVRRIPIVAVTALVMPGDRERCLEAGCDEYVAKPLGLRQLAELVRRFVLAPQGE